MIALKSSRDNPNWYNVNWKSQESHILKGLRNLAGQAGALTDVTLACDGEYIQAHKLVLSLCSPFFNDLFQKHRADKANTIVILGNVSARNLRYLLRFMYQGQIDIPRNHVDSFLDAGNTLKVEGLMGNGSTSTTEEQDRNTSIPSCSKSTKVKSGFPDISSGARRQERDWKTRQTKSNVELLSDQEMDEDDEGNQSLDCSSPIKIEARTVIPSGDEDELHNVSEEEGQPKATRRKSSLPSKLKGRASNNKNKLKSVFWKYFWANSTRTLAKCKLCTEKTVIRTKFGDSNLAATTGLKRHLQSVHPDTDLTQVPFEDDDQGPCWESGEDEGSDGPENSTKSAVSSQYGRIMARRKKSGSTAWNYFIPNSSRSLAKCKLCKEKTIIIKTRNGVAKGLIRHLENVHPGTLKGYPRNEPAVQSGEGNMIGDSDNPPAV